MGSVTKTEGQIQQIIARNALNLRAPPRCPILHNSSEAGLKYEHIFFPSYDGFPLEGWFIPCASSTELVICNELMGFTRSDHPTHLAACRIIFTFPENTIEVNLIPDYKILHDAGYDVLTYDLHNFDQSDPTNTNPLIGGKYEARDVIDSLRYARSRPDTNDMAVGLFSRCLGFTARPWVMHLFPQFFQDGKVRCLVGPQAISAIGAMEQNF